MLRVCKRESPVPKTKKSSVSKAEFVRSLPPSLPAREVIAKAKAAGLSLSSAYVYVLRSSNKKRGAKGAKSSSGRGPGRPRSDASVEGQFFSLVLDLGLLRAEALLASV